MALSRRKDAAAEDKDVGEVRRGLILGTYWSVDDLPGQLPVGVYADRIHGPTYHQDGRRVADFE